LLAFKVLDEKLVEIAHRFDTPEYLVRLSAYCIEKKPFLCLLAALESSAPSASRKISSPDDRCTTGAATNPKSQFSRGKSQFSSAQLLLRRQLGSQYLDLLRFFLNHRTLCAAVSLNG